MSENLLELNNIFLNIECNDQDEVFDHIANIAVTNNVISSENMQQLILALKKREKMSSTGLGDHIAIPHCRSNIVLKPAVLFLRLKNEINWKSVDKKLVRIIIVLLIPNDEVSNTHMEILSVIATKLIEPSIRNILQTSNNKVEIIKTLLENQKSVKESSHNKKHHILAITACPVGVAHTYIAADKLRQGANNLDYNLKVETHGSAGVKGEFSVGDIKNADVIIIASDIGVDLSRFVNKKIYKIGVSQAIRNPEKVLDDSLKNAKVETNIEFTAEKSANSQKSVLKHLMTGVGYMVPFVILGGILIALSISLAKIITNDYEANPKDVPFLGYLEIIGNASFLLMIPILSGFIAFSIAGRAALVPAMVSALVGNNGDNFYKFINWEIKYPGTQELIKNVPMGFVGAIIAGLISGYLVSWINRWKVPRSLAPTIPIFFIPIVVGGLLSLSFIFLIGAPISYIMTWFQFGISWVYSNKEIGRGLAFAVGLLIGAMAGFDMGGPINKVAFLTTGALVTMKIYEPMGTMAAAIPVAPLGMGLSTLIFRKYFDQESKQAGISAIIMGIIGISEGAIPFAIKDPKRAIISNVIGSSLAGGFAGLFAIKDYANHGGPIMAFLGAVPYGKDTGIFLLIILLASLITAVIYGFLLISNSNNKIDYSRIFKVFKRGKK